MSKIFFEVTPARGIRVAPEERCVKNAVVGANGGTRTLRTSRARPMAMRVPRSRGFPRRKCETSRCLRLDKSQEFGAQPRHLQGGQFVLEKRLLLPISTALALSAMQRAFMPPAASRGVGSHQHFSAVGPRFAVPKSLPAWSPPCSPAMGTVERVRYWPFVEFAVGPRWRIPMKRFRVAAGIRGAPISWSPTISDHSNGQRRPNPRNSDSPLARQAGCSRCELPDFPLDRGGRLEQPAKGAVKECELLLARPT